ncbi:hypothetical protein CMO90_01655 [Candidatus Woesearchaeota archaeon]|jgi:ABC-type dipeptide/oligopeptide/nickel transport system permease component|nr:hypothetical protein [Candidatus Woesearchaeota archaeon]
MRIIKKLIKKIMFLAIVIVLIFGAVKFVDLDNVEITAAAIKETPEKIENITKKVEKLSEETGLKDKIKKFFNKIGGQDKKIIGSLTETYRLWNSDELINFSRSLIKTDELIANLNNKAASDKWYEILDCNGSCPEKVLELISLIRE